jgi:hypothetical protein
MRNRDGVGSVGGVEWKGEGREKGREGREEKGKGQARNDRQWKERKPHAHLLPLLLPHSLLTPSSIDWFVRRSRIRN